MMALGYSGRYSPMEMGPMEMERCQKSQLKLANRPESIDSEHLDDSSSFPFRVYLDNRKAVATLAAFAATGSGLFKAGEESERIAFTTQEQSYSRNLDQCVVIQSFLSFQRPTPLSYVICAFSKEQNPGTLD